MIERAHEDGPQAEYSLGCRSCRQLTLVSGASTHFDCKSCGRASFLVACGRCGGANVVLGAGRTTPSAWTCDWCLVESTSVGFKRTRPVTATAAEAWQALDNHALTYGDDEVRVVGGFELVGGHGDCPPRGTLCSIAALADGILVVADAGATGRVMLPYHSVLNIEVGGRGFIQTNAGIVGGGSGLRGALTGMAFAHVVNNATAKTTVDSFLRITGNESEMLFSHWKLPPATIRNALGRIFTGQLAAARTGAQSLRVESPVPTPPPAKEPASPIDELERLTKLHAAGTLTDTEFEIARARQIKRLHSEVP